MKENDAHKKLHGTYRFGTTVGGVKLNDEIVREIRRRFRDGETQTALAAEFGIGQQTACKIVHRKTWRHVG